MPSYKLPRSLRRWLQSRRLSSKLLQRASHSSWVEKHVTFYRIHFACFILVATVATIILWGIGNSKGGHFSFVDCYLGITSALCLSGLTAIPVEDIPAGGQVLLMLMMIVGSQIFTSIIPLLVKKHRYCKVVKAVMARTTTTSTTTTTEGSSDPESTLPPNTLVRNFSRSEPDAGAPSWRRKSLDALMKLGDSMKRIAADEAWMAETAKKQESEHLKEIFQEHEATGVLIHIILAYMVLIQLIGVIIGWTILQYGHIPAGQVIRHKKENIGFFTLFGIVSAFCNVGYILANENMVPFNYSPGLLLDMTVVIYLGNTLYPACLRVIIWLLHRYDKGPRTAAYEFLLEHPRKCYTHLFPPKITLWLFYSFLAINTFQVVVVYSLDWNSSAFEGLNPFDKFVNGVFQCANTRSGGMNSVAITGLSPTTLFIFAVIM